MPDLGSAFSQWILSQLDGLPTSFLRGGVDLLTVDRLLAHIFEKKEAAGVRAILNRPPEGMPRVATILLPGILGSLLSSTRGLSTLLWFNPSIILDGHLNLMNLAPDGKSDRSPDVNIVPVGIEKMTYLPLIMTLAQQSRLYEFPYDWRRSVELHARELHKSIKRWTVADPSRQFVLVAHSMGGLVTRAYLALYPQEAEDHVARVIYIGVPLNGAPAASLAFTRKLHPGQLIDRLHAQNDIMGFTINLPSMYQLLPPPKELFKPERDYPFDWDIYDATSWPGTDVRQDYLDNARAYHELVASSDPQVEQVSIAGCHRRTAGLVSRASDSADSPFKVVYYETGPESGDEQVPLWSAHIEGIKTYYIEDGHNSLASNDQVLAAVTNLIQGKEVELSTEMPEPSDLFMPLRNISLIQRVAELRERIEKGELSRKDIESFFFTR